MFINDSPLGICKKGKREKANVETIGSHLEKNQKSERLWIHETQKKITA